MKPPNPPVSQPSITAGFSLVEVSLALGIAAFGLVAVFGLLPVGINSNQAASEQTAAVNLTSAIVTDLRVTPRTAAASPALGILFPTAPTLVYPAIDGTSTQTLYLDESGGPTPAPTTLSATSRYRVTVNFAQPTVGQRTATLARVTLTWPAPAPPANASGSFSTLIGLDRN